MTEAGLRAVLEVVSDGVVAADADGRIVWLNPAAERLLGARTAELVGRPGESVSALRAGRAVQLEIGSVRLLTVFYSNSNGHESPRETAHDFNNVLSIIRTYASFILDKARAEADAGGSDQWSAVGRDAEMIVEAVTEGLRLCEQLVDDGRP